MTADESTAERRLILSMQPADASQRRNAYCVMLLSLAVFAIAAPFARTPWPRIPAFMACYETALIMSDIITSALLFGQFAISRAPALRILASGYLFTALMTVSHALTFPDLFVDMGLLGAGMQSTAWLYMFWHGGFPLAVIWYARRKHDAVSLPVASIPRAILAACGVVVVVVVALTLLATAGEDLLPAIMQGNGYRPALTVVITIVWATGTLAFLALFKSRPYSVLDAWLMAVVCAWLCDVALSAVLNAHRFDLGFYVGRAYGLLAANFVLVVLLLETIALYGRLARSFEAERRERERRLGELHNELVHVSRLSELGQMVSALAHEVNQPLTAIRSYLSSAQRLVRSNDLSKVKPALDRAANEVARASDIIQRLRDFLRKKESEKSSEDIRSMIDDTVVLALIGYTGLPIKIDVQVDPEASVAIIDKIQIQQVMLNLIRNAIEAMSHSSHRNLLIAADRLPDNMVRISVSDTGPGLPAVVRDKLFQPFVTTKSDGMGVGLSICRSIIEAHGGQLWADEQDGDGAVFRLTVPAA